MAFKDFHRHGLQLTYQRHNIIHKPNCRIIKGQSGDSTPSLLRLALRPLCFRIESFCPENFVLLTPSLLPVGSAFIYGLSSVSMILFMPTVFSILWYLETQTLTEICCVYSSFFFLAVILCSSCCNLVKIKLQIIVTKSWKTRLEYNYLLEKKCHLVH